MQKETNHNCSFKGIPSTDHKNGFIKNYFRVAKVPSWHYQLKEF